jgi:hypothetical protein
MPIDIVFDFAAVHIIGEKAADLDLRQNPPLPVRSHESDRRDPGH